MPAPRAATALAEAVEQLHEFDAEPLRAAFMARGLEALTQVARRLTAAELGKAVASRTTTATVLTAFAQPSVAGLLGEDPLAPARLRGVRARDALLAAEGGPLTAEEAGARLHISRQAIDKRRLGGQLLALTLGRRGYSYPAWQFVDEGLLPGLPEILALLEEHPPLAKLRFFLSGNVRLGGDRPLDRLRRGDLDPVRRAARTFGEQGAA